MKRSTLRIFAFLACAFILSACSGKNASLSEGTSAAITEPVLSGKESDDELTVEPEPIIKAENIEGHLYDDKDLYKDQDDYSVITMYLTVSKGNTGDSSFHTWSEVNTFSAYDYKNAGITDRYKVEGLLQIDDTGTGINEDSFGYGETLPNVSVQVRGQTSSRGKQKNYKIRIKDGRGEFRGQRTLNLNKHRTEPFRFTNKLSYDLANSVPQLIAGRTQFVHLYVKDDTSSVPFSPGNVSGESVSADKTKGADTDEKKAGRETAVPPGYQDYGLFTMVEQVNRTYLKNHGFDENGQLYKVTFFEWNMDEALMIDQDDPLFDQSKFDEYLESKGNNDHSNLQQTITDIQNFSIPIDHILEEHFDVENIIYFLAFNIMIGNADVGARNLFLYSPLNSKKIYFLCWDMDNCFLDIYKESEGYSDAQSWERGMNKYLGLALINRMMKEPKYLDMLSQAVDDIYQHYVTPDIVVNRAQKYAEVVKPYLFSSPDSYYAPLKDQAKYDEMVSLLGEEVELNYRLFKESLNWPWPFFVHLPSIDRKNNQTIFSWDTSFNYGRNVTYNYILATDPMFENILDEGHDLVVPIATTKILDPGTYFLRVNVKGDTGYVNDCYDYYELEDGAKCYGCYCFIVKDDGTVMYYQEEKV